MVIDKIAEHIRERMAQTWSRPSWWNLLITLPWILALAHATYEWTITRAVAERQKTVLGRITAHQPANHNRYGYSFSVNGKTYNGWEIPRRETLHVGQSRVVYYDPTDPSKNALTDFAELKDDSLNSVPLVLIGIGTVAFVILLLRTRRKNPVDPKE